MGHNSKKKNNAGWYSWTFNGIEWDINGIFSWLVGGWFQPSPLKNHGVSE
jgi:hypothetical protein